MGAHNLSHHRFHCIRVVLKSNSIRSRSKQASVGLLGWPGWPDPAVPEVSVSQASEKQREKAANCRTVTLSKTEGEKIGFTVAPKQDYAHMGRAGDGIITEVVGQVTKVFPGGALSKHNELQPDAAIQEGDVILSVNGVHGDFDAMSAQLANASVVFEVERRGAQVHIF